MPLISASAWRNDASRAGERYGGREGNMRSVCMCVRACVCVCARVCGHACRSDDASADEGTAARAGWGGRRAHHAPAFPSCASSARRLGVCFRTLDLSALYRAQDPGEGARNAPQRKGMEGKEGDRVKQVSNACEGCARKGRVSHARMRSYPDLAFPLLGVFVLHG